MIHDVTIDETESSEDILIRTPAIVEGIKPQKRMEWCSIDEFNPLTRHGFDVEPKGDIMWTCYRTQYVKSFPVTREDGTIINGHNRIKAARAAGLDRHPVEVINVTGDQAVELAVSSQRSLSGIEVSQRRPFRKTPNVV